MSDVAAHPAVRAALPGDRRGAARVAPRRSCATWRTIGGNLLQRTRCPYFRDTGFACNKRAPGSGCAALGGENRMHAILGASDALHRHASVRPRRGAGGARRGGATARAGRRQRAMPSPSFYRLPGDTPDIETVLRAGRAHRRRSRFRPARPARIALSEGQGPRELRVRAGLGRGRARHADGTHPRGAGRAGRRRHQALAPAAGGGGAGGQAADRERFASRRGARRRGRAAGSGTTPSRSS